MVRGVVPDGGVAEAGVEGGSKAIVAGYAGLRFRKGSLLTVK